MARYNNLITKVQVILKGVLVKWHPVLPMLMSSYLGKISVLRHLKETVSGV